MKRTIAAVILSVCSLTGCYTNVCPTYSVNPDKLEELKVEKPVENAEIKDKKAS